jgi:YegS/Rv2252/BmrU family lipid kinase
MAREALARHGAKSLGDASVVVTRAAGDAALAAEAARRDGVDRVVAWGGDGTVNEVAGPLIGTRTALGIVPAGSGDGLAGSLGLPRRPEYALRLALLGPSGPMDVGWLGDRHFLNVAGIGFDAAVGRAFNHSATRGLGAYVRLALAEIWRYQPDSYELTVNGATLRGPRLLVAFANGREYGNRMVLAAGADPTDGLLDLIVVDAGSAWRQCWRARRLLVGRDLPAVGITRHRVAKAQIAGSRLVCHVDGETFEVDGVLDVRIQPLALHVAGLSPLPASAAASASSSA